MAGELLRIGDSPNVTTAHFCVDTIEEVSFLPTTTSGGTGTFKGRSGFEYSVPMGSTCVVGNSGDTKYYALFTTGWQEV